MKLTITLDRKEAEELLEVIDNLIFDLESENGIAEDEKRLAAMLRDKLGGRISKWQI